MRSKLITTVKRTNGQNSVITFLITNEVASNATKYGLACVQQKSLILSCLQIASCINYCQKRRNLMVKERTILLTTITSLGTYFNSNLFFTSFFILRRVLVFAYLMKVFSNEVMSSLLEDCHSLKSSRRENNISALLFVLMIWNTAYSWQMGRKAGPFFVFDWLCLEWQRTLGLFHLNRDLFFICPFS